MSSHYDRDFAERVHSYANDYLEELISSIRTAFSSSQLELMKANPEEYPGTTYKSFARQASAAASELEDELEWFVQRKKFGLSLLVPQAVKLAPQFREAVRRGRYF
mgnify:CR=1 FL=1|jgi:hypothetical protein